MPTPPATPLVSGLGGAIGGDFRAVWNRLYFVEFDGKLSRLDLIPRARIIRSGTLTIPGTHTLDLDTGTLSPAGDAADLWWQQMTTSTRQLTPVNGAEVHRIGPANYARLTCARLMALAYTTDPVSGTPGSGNRMTPGTVVAVRTNRGNYAKLQVRSSGYDLQIRFTTYRPSPAYRILGTGYQQPEDVALSADGTRAWITERTGNLLRVELSSPGRSSATVVASGLTAPHQIALDEAHGRAYVVEHASNGRLLRIDLATGNVTTLLTGLSRAVGLLLDAEGTSAWISEQGSTPDTGRIVRHRLDSGHSEPVATGLVNPFFLRWTDPAETGILVAERDPANRITRVETATGGGPVTTRVVAAGVPARPSSVALISETDLLVLSDAVVSRVALAEAVLDPGGPLLLGIGHVPAERISRGTNPARAGYADTTQLTNYFFQVRHAPFGGTLPIMVNFPAAWAAGARHYKLFVNGVEPRQGWTDLRWSTSVNRFVTQQVNPDSGGYYRVRPPPRALVSPLPGVPAGYLGPGRRASHRRAPILHRDQHGVGARRTPIGTPHRPDSGRQHPAPGLHRPGAPQWESRGRLRDRGLGAGCLRVQDHRPGNSGAPPQLGPGGALGRQPIEARGLGRLRAPRLGQPAVGRHHRRGSAPGGGCPVGRRGAGRSHLDPVRPHLPPRRLEPDHRRLEPPLPRGLPHLHHADDVLISPAGLHAPLRAADPVLADRPRANRFCLVRPPRLRCFGPALCRP